MKEKFLQQSKTIKIEKFKHSTMKTLISEEKINSIVESAIKKVLYEEYHLNDLDELYGYTRLDTTITGLDIDLFVDNSETYKMYNHQLLAFIRNGYDKNIMEFIPFAVSKEANILDTSIDYNVNSRDILSVQQFIRMNVSPLKKLADGELIGSDFIERLSVPSFVIREEKELLLEMSVLRKKTTNLPMDIWVDEVSTYQGHAPRIKFRANNEQHNSSEFSTMTLTNPPQIINMPKTTTLKKGDIEKLKAFVINNLELLIQLANGKITLLKDFLPNMIKAN